MYSFRAPSQKEGAVAINSAPTVAPRGVFSYRKSGGFSDDKGPDGVFVFDDQLRLESIQGSAKPNLKAMSRKCQGNVKEM